MKFGVATIIFCICIHLNVSNCKSLKSYSGNSINPFKGQRKPFASPFGNAIHDNYKRAKRQTSEVTREYQEILNNAKAQCVREMNMDRRILEKSLMYEENPSHQEKCLMMCMLKKTKLMENNNKISLKTIARMAGALSENNPLLESVAVAAANNCNSMITTAQPCEAAYQINKCISKELKAKKLKLFY